MKEASQQKGSAWWVWLIAGSFLLDFGLILHNDWAGPTLGILTAYKGGSIVVQDNYARAETVPLQDGDRILRADGQDIASDADWFVVLSNLRVDKPVIFEIQRDTEDLQVSVTPRPRWSLAYFSVSVLVFVRIVQMMGLAVACFVAFARPRNTAALLTALFFFGESVLNVPSSLSGFSAVLHDLPRLVLGPLSITGIVAALTPLFLFLFCITFPRPLIQSTWILVLLCLPPVVSSIPSVIYAQRLVYDPGRAFGMFSEPFYIGVNVTAAAYFVAAPFALALNYRRLTDVNERRRVRVLVFGAVVGLLALVSVIFAIVVPPLRNGVFGRFIFAPNPVTALVISGLLAFPASFAYAVLRHRLFDVRVIVRQGLQYAMARRVLLSALPLLAAVSYWISSFIDRNPSLLSSLHEA
jgi:eukaryotic-like serine/threonine-protein kinase